MSPSSPTFPTGEAYFGEDDEILTSKLHAEEFQPLSWRVDPEISHSDWTIVMTNSETGAKQTFHVHKNILGVGPRKCRYFSTLFVTIADVVEKQESTSRLDLAGPYADTFPILLDFCYSLTDLNDLTHDVLDALTVVALRHLARYFDCAALMRKTNDFVRRDLSVATGPQYLVAAARYQDVRLEEAARNLCAEHFAVLSRKQVLELPVDQFQSLLASPSLNCDSKYLASVTLAFFQQHPEILTVSRLSHLTDEHKMPLIGKVDAPTYLDLIRKLSVTATEEWNMLRSLCLRCSKALVKKKEWLSWDVQAEGQIHCLTANESANQSTATTVQPEAEILVSRLVASLIEARRDYHDESSRLKAQVESLTIKLADMITMKDKLQNANQELQSKTSAQKKQIESLNDKVSSYRKKVKEQQRKHWSDSL